LSGEGCFTKVDLTEKDRRAEQDMRESCRVKVGVADKRR
jgi:hypothetical protein